MGAPLPERPADDAIRDPRGCDCPLFLRVLAGARLAAFYTHGGQGQDATLLQKMAAFTHVISAPLASGLTNGVTCTTEDHARRRIRGLLIHWLPGR